MLGFEATSLANEGTFVLAVKNEDADRAVEVLKTFAECSSAAVIGSVTCKHPKKVILKSGWGTSRFLETPSGELLPRIC